MVLPGRLRPAQSRVLGNPNSCALHPYTCCLAGHCTARQLSLSLSSRAGGSTDNEGGSRRISSLTSWKQRLFPSLIARILIVKNEEGEKGNWGINLNLEQSWFMTCLMELEAQTSRTNLSYIIWEKRAMKFIF